MGTGQVETMSLNDRKYQAVRAMHNMPKEIGPYRKREHIYKIKYSVLSSTPYLW